MHTAALCREKAARFRALALNADNKTAANLLTLAGDYESLARKLEPRSGPGRLE